MHYRGVHPLDPDSTTNRSILRQSVLDQVCCARQIRDPSPSSLNPSSHRRLSPLFPLEIRPRPLEPTIWNFSRLPFDPAEKKLCFDLARTTNSRRDRSRLILKNSSKPRHIPNDPPSPSSSPIFSSCPPISTFLPTTNNTIPSHPAAGSVQSTPKHGLRLGLLRACPALLLAANCRTHVAVNLWRRPRPCRQEHGPRQPR